MQQNFLPGATATTQDSTSCTGANCLTVDGNSYAALLIFAGARIEDAPFNQLRQDPYVEVSTSAGDVKTEKDNYLEGSNATSNTLFGNYTALSAADQAKVNDRIYCLQVNAGGAAIAYTLNNKQPVCSN